MEKDLTFITARIRRKGEGNIFSLSVHTRGRGYPSPRFLPRSLVPGPFWGVPQSQVLSQVSGASPFWGPKRSCCGHYASCGFPQEDFLVLWRIKKRELLMYILVFIGVCRSLHRGESLSHDTMGQTGKRAHPYPERTSQCSLPSYLSLFQTGGKGMRDYSRYCLVMLSCSLQVWHEVVNYYP